MKLNFQKNQFWWLSRESKITMNRNRIFKMIRRMIWIKLNLQWKVPLSLVRKEEYLTWSIENMPRISKKHPTSSLVLWTFNLNFKRTSKKSSRLKLKQQLWYRNGRVGCSQEPVPEKLERDAKGTLKNNMAILKIKWNSVRNITLRNF